MGSLQLPSQSSDIIKLILVGGILTDGRLTARGKCGTQLQNEAHFSRGALYLDCKVDHFKKSNATGVPVKAHFIECRGSYIECFPLQIK